jgi:hypothetical protein
VLIVIAYGLAGFLVTGALTAGAWALAGKDISHPAPIAFPAQAIQASPKPTESPSRDHHDKHEDGSEDHLSASPSPEDHGGGSDSGSGSSGSISSADTSGSPDGSSSPEDHGSGDHEPGDD